MRHAASAVVQSDEYLLPGTVALPSQVQLINILNIEIAELGQVVADDFWPAPGR
jgi:hypothetical protein